MKLLHVNSSALGTQSVSRALTRDIVGRLRAAMPHLEVTPLDLDASPLPHLSSATLAKADATEAARSAEALEQFLAADVVVIGAPMYNFAIPSTLKAWIDRLAVAGKTFRYTATGPQGLAGGKRVIVALATGGEHPSGAPGDFAEPYLRFMFRFFGIDDVTFVRAEGLAVSAEHRARGLAAARAAIDRLVPLPLAA
jgi:FMN-dependent NADH-azoreductase